MAVTQKGPILFQTASLPCLVYLTNQKWFSIVFTLLYNKMHYDSGQNVVDSQGAAQ